MDTEPSSALEQLASTIGGEIQGGELYYGPLDSQIFISALDNGNFYLASEHPLYAIKNGKPRRVAVAKKDADAGWYYATVSPEQLPTVLDLALGTRDPENYSVEFAYEHILRDYCAHNLSRIEAGLSLYKEDGKSGVEFPAAGRFIDILTVDSSGGFVVFELKLSRGHERVVGQLLRYMGWVRANLATSGQRVRGAIIARHITQDLRFATANQTDITLLEYELDIKLKSSPLSK